jgi:proline iminopeptidase
MSNFLEIQPGISLHYQTFGNPSAIPVLFVHGGPGACCEDYQNINQKFFNTANYYVIEVDQRGTGKSQPSVRDNHTNMQHYLDITITQMSSDFELLRKHLNITKWLVFGGSWGSTLGLDYACTYPSVCLGLILRGIFLNTKAEHDAIYARKSFTNDVRRLKEFDIFHELALKEDDKLEPNDSKYSSERERASRIWKHCS